jgi:hypothetical protein
MACFYVANSSMPWPDNHDWSCVTGRCFELQGLGRRLCASFLRTAVCAFRVTRCCTCFVPAPYVFSVCGRTIDSICSEFQQMTTSYLSESPLPHQVS